MAGYVIKFKKFTYIFPPFIFSALICNFVLFFFLVRNNHGTPTQAFFKFVANLPHAE